VTVDNNDDDGNELKQIVNARTVFVKFKQGGWTFSLPFLPLGVGYFVKGG